MEKMGRIQMFCNGLHDDTDRCVRWAAKQIEKGQDTDSLKKLAGMTQPYTDGEVRTHLKAALKELSIKVLNPKQAVLEFARDILAETVEDMDSIEKNLGKLRKLSINNDFPDELYKFYELSFAYDELVRQKENKTEYWPKANRENIDDIVLEECKKGL